MPQPFHLAIPVHELEIAAEFYRTVLGCETGRSSDHWIDFNFFGHQLVLHQPSKAAEGGPVGLHNQVDGDEVPVPHFGVVLNPAEFEKLASRLREQGVRFVIEPHTRFAGQPGEQSTMFLLDPSGNALEFKAFARPESLFAT